MAAREHPEILRSGRFKPGVRFAPGAELDLHAAVVPLAVALPAAHAGLALVAEPPGPFGIPDFVGVYGARDRVDARLGLAVPPLLNRIDAGIVAALSAARPLSVASIGRRTGWRPDTVERRLPGLVRAGAVQLAGSGTYVRPAALTSIGRLLAIEVKVRDWRRAVLQGRTYASWCDTYAIVLGRLPVTSGGDVVSQVRRDAAGLAVDGRWVIRPRLTQAGRTSLWGSEHVVAALRGQHAEE
jgi:DNA-binding Lrp family transcriptional regulator